MTEWLVILLVGLTVVFIGLSKAGFGGDLGVLTSPLCVVAFGIAGQSQQFAIGFLLPLLCEGDGFSLYHYWGKWRLDNLKYLLRGGAFRGFDWRVGDGKARATAFQPNYRNFGG